MRTEHIKLLLCAVTFCFTTIISLFTGCTNNVTDPKETVSGAAAVTVNLGKVGVLAKRSTIEMKRLVIQISVNETDSVVVTDTSDLSGYDESTVNTIFSELIAPQDFNISAKSIDAGGKTIHNGKVSFSTIPGDTVDVSLKLDAKYSMLRVSFNDLPDSVNGIVLGIIDVDTLDSLFDAGSRDSVVLEYDYLEADTVGIEYDLWLRSGGCFYGTDTILYAADTTIIARSGVDKSYQVVLKWVGPGVPDGAAEITVTIGAVGTSLINAEFDKITSPINNIYPQAWVKISDSFGPATDSYRAHEIKHSVYNPKTNKLLILEKPLSDDNTFPSAYLITPETFEPLSVNGFNNRENTMIAYYGKNDTYVVFGGWKLSDSYLSDTWEYSGENWIQRQISGPSKRANSTMFYQPNTELLYLFGGSLYQTQYDETWVWNGDTWTELSASGPSARMWPTTVYMPSEGKTLLFGGCEDYDSKYLADTWTWDGNTWEQVSVRGPEPRRLPIMVYNKITSSVFMVGGISADSSNFSSTWEWNGKSWTKTDILTPPIRNGVIWFDNTSQKVYLYGRTEDGIPTRELWVLQ